MTSPGVRAALRFASFALLPLLANACDLRAQRWQDLAGRSPSGLVELRQAVRDAGSDGLALLVASHPDDRYLLPAVWLRYVLGVRVAVLIASRGGGAQNSLGPETGDALERIRTLETEAGCAAFHGDVYYLDRPDRGFRRSAAETFEEWGRDETKAELVRMLRTIAPDIVLSTHHAEEAHGHDLALAELLPEAVREAADAAVPGAPPHRVRGLFLGATSRSATPAVVVHGDEFEPDRGAGLRRLAHDILRLSHVSPGAPGPMESVFTADMLFESLPLPWPAATDLRSFPSLFDTAIWPGVAADAAALRAQLNEALPACGEDRERLLDTAVAALRTLESLACPPGSDAARRRARRIEALQRVVLHSNALQIEVETRPGAVAVPGEEVDFDVRVHVGGPRPLDGVELEPAAASTATFEPVGTESTAVAAGGVLRAALVHRVPLGERAGTDPMADAFHGDRFVPPVQLRFLLRTCGVAIPLTVVPPIESRPPLELAVSPRMLLCPTNREEVKFSVEVVRNSAFPIVGDVDVRAPAGYQVLGERRHIDLRAERGDTFDFTLRPVADRKTGVDVIRIGAGENRIALPLHRVDVQIDPRLRIGVLRSRDDALVSVIGVGGFGLRWSELSDTDLAARDLAEFDTIVVDVRALRDRPAARRAFRRLLDFCGGRGKRLVVFYHKDVEFEPPGERFVGAPILPFAIGKDRVTHADAPITVLRPECCLLLHPNRIQAADWDGWEQERGLYFPSVYAADYQEVLEVGDPGLAPKRSALLYARTGPGQGEYVYCALSLWRQLKKLHPGCVRLLANLLTPQPAGS